MFCARMKSLTGVATVIKEVRANWKYAQGRILPSQCNFTLLCHGKKCKGDFLRCTIYTVTNVKFQANKYFVCFQWSV